MSNINKNISKEHKIYDFKLTMIVWHVKKVKVHWCMWSGETVMFMFDGVMWYYSSTNKNVAMIYTYWTTWASSVTAAALSAGIETDLYCNEL